MNTILRFSSSLACLIVIVGAGQVAIAQQPKKGNRTPAPVTTTSKVQVPTEQLVLSEKIIQPAGLTVNKLPAKAFKKTSVLNPNNGKPTSADSMFTFTVTKDGKKSTIKMKAGEYYDQLNATEKSYNDIGYSVFDKPGGSPVLLQAMVSDPKVIENQVKNAPVSTLPRASATTTKATFGTTSKSTQQLKVKEGSIKLEPKPASANLITPKTVSRVESNRWEFGEQSTFQAHLRVKLESSGAFYKASTTNSVSDMSHCEFHIEGVAGGFVLDQSFNVLDAVADFKCPMNNGDITATATVTVLGKTLFNLNEKARTSWTQEKEYSKSVKVEVPFRVPVGPISVKGVVGVSGTAGLRYDMHLDRSGFNGTVSPFVEIKGYGEAGVDLLIAGGGVGAELTVASADIDLSAAAYTDWSGNKMSLIDEFYLGYDVNFMSGRLYCYAYVMVPAWKLPPWEEKRFEHNFFKWDGYKKSGSFVNVSKTTQF